MFYSVVAQIFLACTPGINQYQTSSMSVQDQIVLLSHTRNYCIQELNSCVRKRLKGTLIGWTTERKEEELSKCISKMEMFKKT